MTAIPRDLDDAGEKRHPGPRRIPRARHEILVALAGSLSLWAFADGNSFNQERSIVASVKALALKQTLNVFET